MLIIHYFLHTGIYTDLDLWYKNNIVHIVTEGKSSYLVWLHVSFHMPHLNTRNTASWRLEYTADLPHQSPLWEFKWKPSLSEGHISAESQFFYSSLKIQAMPTDSTASFTDTV